MKKFLIRFSLSLYILLLGGYSQLHAHAYRDFGHTSTNLSETQQNASVGIEQKGLASIIEPALAGRWKELFQIDITEVKEEEDEHESVSFRKNSKSSNYLAILCAQTSGYFFNNSNISPIANYCSSRASYRYLIFQVFRI